MASELVAVWMWRYVTNEAAASDLNGSPRGYLQLLVEVSRTGGQQAEAGTPSRLGESVRKRTASGQNMNMSARVVFGTGRLGPKQLFFASPQTDLQRKGGKRRTFSFSVRFRLGIIRGRSKGKT